MRILINHLTRMQPGYICVAGLDEDTGQHIRPVLLGMLGEHWVARYGGPFDIGEVIDLGEVVDARRSPQVEDRRFVETAVVSADIADPELFWKVLIKRSENSLEDVFGPDLVQRGSSAITEEGEGLASLGLIQPDVRPSLFIVTNTIGKQRLRIHVNDGHLDCQLSVTDLRFYDEQNRIRMDTVANVNERLSRGVNAILSVGLTRAWSQDDSQQAVHWLQCNNIHLADQPLWRLVDSSPTDLRYAVPPRLIAPH